MTCDILFSHPIFHPTFLNKTGRLNYFEYSDINVTKDLFDIEFDHFSDFNDPLNYSVYLIDWATDKIRLLFNFSDPLLISQGLELDKAYFTVIDPEMFVSQVDYSTLES